MESPGTGPKEVAMGFVDEVIFDAIWDAAQYFYFTVKNKRRARAFTAFAGENGLSFDAKLDDYKGELMQMNAPSSAELKAQGKKRLSRKARHASRWFGDSSFQTRLWAFNTNRLRGDWQVNCNIMEGTWKGHLMTSFDTIWNEVGNADREGEYTSVFAHCKTADMPQAIITPTGLLSLLKRADQGQLLNAGYHTQKFESTEFNSTWRVSSIDQRKTSDFISQNMMEYLLEHSNEKWHVEMSPGGILISTVYTLSTAKIELAMDFLAGLLEHIDADLLGGSAQ